MPNPKTTALAKLNGIKLTTFNAIAELEMRAAKARDEGDAASETALTGKALELTRSSIKIRQAEDEIRSGGSLGGTIAKLDAIARDGRKTLRALKAAEDALGDAATLLSIIARIAAIF